MERCGVTQTCQDGQCLENNVCNNECEEGQTKCEGDSIYECGYVTSGLTCQEWQFVDNCRDYGKICQNSSCVDVAPSCTNECNNSGQKVCDGNSWKECGNYDNDSCREWSSLTSCGNQSCDGGECVIPERFTDLGNGSLRDNNTQEVWQKVSSSTIYTQAAAIDYCANLILAGSSNWTLPMGDLFSYINRQYGENVDCGLYPEFEGPCGTYWTSDSCWGSGEGRVEPFVSWNGSLCVNQTWEYLVRCIKE